MTMDHVLQWFSVTNVLVVGTVSLISFLIWRLLQSLKYLESLGFPGPKPLPLVGNTLTMSNKGFADATVEWKKQYGKVYGLYLLDTPCVVVSDLDLVRDVMVKKFSCFPNRMPQKMTDYQPWSDMLLQLNDDHWKHVRSELSPSFSSMKLKKMLPVINRVVKNLDQHVKTFTQSGEPVELKKLCGHFTLDAIAGAAFGFDVNSLLDPNDSFCKNSMALLTQNFWILPLLVLFPSLGPLLFHTLGIGVISTKVIDYLIGVLGEALKERRQDTKKYNDFLQLMVDAEKEGEKRAPVDAEIDHSAHLSTSKQWTRSGLTDDEIKANAMVFLLAGYDTTSNSMSFTIYLLAAHPDVLKKAQDEVDEKLGQDPVNYDKSLELTYLDMCISEANRLYPSAVILDRYAACDVELGEYKIKKGMGVIIPTFAIHKDPNIWPEPDKFDPERFTPKAKAGRHPFAHLPFGHGPRNCIGMRLAQLEIRMALATLLQHYTPVLCEKSVYPPVIAPPQMEIKAKDGLWVKFMARE